MLNMSTFETLQQLYLICRHVMLVSFCIYKYTRLGQRLICSVRKIKRQETRTSVFKTLTIYSKKKALIISYFISYQTCYTFKSYLFTQGMMRLKLKYSQINFLNFKNWKNEASWSGWDQESRLKRAGSTQLSSI